MVGLEGVQSANIQNQNSGPQSDIGQRTGSWQGQNVSLRQNPTSMIADAAEEMTFAASEKEEAKSIQERTIKQAASRQIRPSRRSRNIFKLRMKLLIRVSLSNLLPNCEQGRTRLKPRLRSGTSPISTQPCLRPIMSWKHKAALRIFSNRFRTR